VVRASLPALVGSGDDGPTAATQKWSHLPVAAELWSPEALEGRAPARRPINRFRTPRRVGIPALIRWRIRRAGTPRDGSFAYSPAFTKSAIRSPITIAVALVLARMQSGMIDASATRSASTPWTWPNWSTTAMLSDAGPILAVPET